MAEVINSNWLLEAYQTFLGTFPQTVQDAINLFILILIVVVYAVFIWKFYKFISKKNLLGLDLNKYNKSGHPFFSKVFASLFYFVEYILILPFLIFFWFAVFTFFLIFLTESLDIASVLIVSATIVGAIRMTSYIPNYGEKLSQEIAKVLPFTMLAIAILNPKFFNPEKILSHLQAIPEFLTSIIVYLVLIIALEIILRFLDFVFSLFGLEETAIEED